MKYFTLLHTQVNDLCSVLEKYRAENQNILAKKDQEIESLRSQLSTTETDKVAATCTWCVSNILLFSES